MNAPRASVSAKAFRANLIILLTVRFEIKIDPLQDRLKGTFPAAPGSQEQVPITEC